MWCGCCATGCLSCISAGSSRAAPHGAFTAPAHPYTQALLSAIPQPGIRRTRIALIGEPQSPIDPDPKICRLYGRCSRATELGRSFAPRLQPVAPGQLAACHHLATEIDEASTAPVPVAVTS